MHVVLTVNVCKHLNIPLTSKTKFKTKGTQILNLLPEAFSSETP